MTNRPDKPTTRRKTNTPDVPPAGDDAAVRLITTKHRTYVLPVDQAGIPVQDYFPGVEWSGPLASAKMLQVGRINKPPFAPTGHPARRYKMAAQARRKPLSG